MRILPAAILALACAAGLSAQRLLVYTEDSPPYNYRDAAGQPTGIAWDIVAEIQRRVEDRSLVRMVPWSQAIAEIDSKPNVVVFSMARTDERETRYQWVGPIGESRFAFYAKSLSDLKLSNLEEAKAVARIGVYRGDVCEQILSGAGFANLERSQDAATPFRMLMGGRIPVIACSPDEVAVMSVNLGFSVDELRLLLVFQRTRLFIAMSKEMPLDTVRAWRQALESMRKDGTFDRIHAKYLPGLPAPAADGS